MARTNSIHWVRVWMLIVAVMGLAAFARAAEPAPPGVMVDLGGRRLHLNCVGSGSPTVLIESGGGSFSLEWALVQAQVAKDVRICSYDRAGYAWSDRGPVDEGIEQTMDDLHLLVRKAPITTPFVLACQSLGCLFARAYQRRFPEQVLGMVFVDGTPDEDVRMVVNGERRPISMLTREQLPGAYEEYRRSLPELKPGTASDPPFDRLPPDLQSARHWAFEKLVREMGWLPDSMATAESWREEFAALRLQRLSEAHPLGTLPLIVLERTKDRDATWHAQQEQLAGLSAEGKLVEAEGSGHMIHLERPDLVAGAIKEIVGLAENRHTTPP